LRFLADMGVAVRVTECLKRRNIEFAEQHSRERRHVPSRPESASQVSSEHGRDQARENPVLGLSWQDPMCGGFPSRRGGLKTRPTGSTVEYPGGPPCKRLRDL